MHPPAPPARPRNRRSLWVRARRRTGREIGAVRGAWADARDLRAFRRGLLTGDELRAAAERLADDPRGASAAAGVGARAGARVGARGGAGLVWRSVPAERLDEWRRAHPGWAEQAVQESRDARESTLPLFDHRYRLDDPGAWHRDPLRRAPWPLRPRTMLRLSGSGDVRMQWEVARFHHALLLGRAWSASRDPAYPQAFLRQVACFEQGNPPYRGIHWAVGMEVAIRAAAIVFALEHFRGAPELDAAWRERLVRLLLLHGHFLEHHIERHPHGFTTNHTTSDYAGLSVLGRFFAAAGCGQRWLGLAAEGLAACLAEQVLAGGAHAEASLPYERYVLEAALVAALCLEPAAAEPLRGPIRRLAEHLRDARLPSGLPFVGDGDESFFPPFGFQPYAARDPLDPEPPLQVAAAWLELPALRREPATREEAFWLGAPVQAEPGAPPRAEPAAPPQAQASVPPPAQASAPQQVQDAAPAPSRSQVGRGLVPFAAGPFAGVMVTRGSGEGWMPTHGHNDLLSLALDVAGEPLLIDPGTGGYNRDPALRHALRSTAAHSTVQLDGLEQSPLRAEAIFEGPPSVPGGVGASGETPAGSRDWHGEAPLRPRVSHSERSLRLRAWHRGWEGACAGVEHARRLSWRRQCLCIEDVITSPDGLDARGTHTTVLRFHLAPGLAPVSSGERGCRVAVAGGELRFLLLRPREILWQIVPGCAARRYGDREDTSLVTAAQTGPLPHRWLAVLLFQKPSGSDAR